MIKLKMKSKKEKHPAQDITELLTSSKEGESLCTFKDVQKLYNEYIKRKADVDFLFYTSFFIFLFGTLGTFLVSSDSNSNNLTMVGCLMTSLCLEFIILSFLKRDRENVLKSFIKGNEHIVIDIKDVLKNMFYERYEKENNFEPIENKILQYVISNLYKKDLNYEDFLRVNLDKELKGIKDSYIELKNKKDELCLLKGLYD
jgi:hypothetical protein